MGVPFPQYNQSNFDNLTAAVNTLQTDDATPLQVLTASSGTSLSLASSTNGVYTGTSLALTQGTWLVQGQASLLTTQNTDAVRLGLYNSTASQEIAGSKSPATTTPTMGVPVGISTPPVALTVTGTMNVQLYGYRNGVSTLAFSAGAAATTATSADVMRITAVRLSH